MTLDHSLLRIVKFNLLKRTTVYMGFVSHRCLLSALYSRSQFPLRAFQWNLFKMTPNYCGKSITLYWIWFQYLSDEWRKQPCSRVDGVLYSMFGKYYCTHLVYSKSISFNILIQQTELRGFSYFQIRRVMVFGLKMPWNLLRNDIFHDLDSIAINGDIKLLRNMVSSIKVHWYTEVFLALLEGFD